ncbi:MAG TPA: MBL fold metallo-hydrolase [Ktedonobacteraceae bacterium]|nr:MBL fold metallo-hydrolase [Ktedonobacteraceae bacterium]
MRVTSLGSGSSGNALLVEAGPRGRTKLLVDVGLPPRTLLERLRLAGALPTQLQGVLVTHEHGDHIIGLPLLNKRYAIPIIAAPDTLAAIEQSFISGTWYTDSGPLPEPSFELETQNGKLRRGIPLPVGTSCVIGDIEVTSFPVSHDAVSPCGYLLRAGGCRVCIAIDSGEVTTTMLDMMRHADLLVLESNHDRDRLLRGPYPYHLKMRILSSTGHLSNAQAAEAVLQTWRADSVRWLWLSHLSRTNNTPKLALQSMLSSLSAAKANLYQLHISVLPPGMGGVWDSTQLWHSPSLWEMEE